MVGKTFVVFFFQRKRINEINSREVFQKPQWMQHLHRYSHRKETFEFRTAKGVAAAEICMV